MPSRSAKAAPSLRLSADECAVWARELSFARSVADHDAAAFAAHLEPQAAFGASQAEPTRGRDAIARRWAGIIDGKRFNLAWYPTRTTIGGVADIAWSSGPSLFEDPDPKAAQRYRIGAFHSVWHRGADGVWRVLFDDGVEPQAGQRGRGRRVPRKVGRAPVHKADDGLNGPAVATAVAPVAAYRGFAAIPAVTRCQR